MYSKGIMIFGDKNKAWSRRFLKRNWMRLIIIKAQFANKSWAYGSGTKKKLF